MKFKKLLGVVFGICFTVLWLNAGYAEEKKDKERLKETVKGILHEIRMEESQQTEEQKKVRTIYDEGFTMLGSDDILKIGVWVQTDVRIFPEGHPGVTQFLVRRARLDFKGSLEKMFGYRVMGEFEGDGGTNTANLKEGWLEYNQFPAFRIKVGQFKEPYGLENLYSDLWLDFLERPIAENFIRPEQDVGLMFFGKLFNKHVEYGLGIFNGSGTNVGETNDDKDFAARLTVTPVEHLTFGGSITYGKQTSTLDGTGPTTQAGTRFITFVNPTTGVDVRSNNFRTRAEGDIELFSGPFSLKGEYVFNRFKNLTFGGAVRSWDIHGFSGQVTYVLTGEEKSNQRSVVPERMFNPKEGTWGAVELALRGETFNSDQAFLNAGFAAGTDDLWSVSSGLNWYLNRHVKISGNYIYNKFDDPIANANGNNEHIGMFRFQFSL